MSLEDKIPVYFLMPDEEPNGESFMKLNHELFMRGFDDSFLQRIMLLTERQHVCFLHWMASTLYAKYIPSGNTQLWEFSGFRIKILKGYVE